MDIIVILAIYMIYLVDVITFIKRKYVERESLARFFLPIVILISNSTSKLSMGSNYFVLYFLVLIIMLFTWGIMGIRYYIVPNDFEEAFYRLKGLIDNQGNDVEIELRKYSNSYYYFGFRPKVRISNYNDKKIMISYYKVLDIRQYKNINNLIIDRISDLELKKGKDLMLNIGFFVLWTILIVYYLIMFF